MNHQIYKNVLSYGILGGFGMYTFYKVAQSEFQRKEKSEHYFNNMINNYIQLEFCNYLNSNKNYNIIIKGITNKEEIVKLINPEKIKYDEKYCTTFYNDFRRSYNNYKLYKYDIHYKYCI